MIRIDAHTHLFAPGQVIHREALARREPAFAAIYGDPQAKMATAENLLAAMSRGEIGAAVAAGFAFASEAEIVAQNGYLLAVANASRGRIVPLTTVNPMLPAWKRLARAALAGGARGFGELRPGDQGWDPLGPEGRALCELASRHDAVLLWHTSEPVGHAYPGKEGGIKPEQLIELAMAYPEVQMVAAHLGGGAAYYLQMPEVRSSIESLYFDTAASSLLYDDEAVARLLELAGADKVLFASDFPLQSPHRQLERLRSLLPPGALDEVCGGNAQRLFQVTLNE